MGPRGGRFAECRAEQGRLGLSGVGEGWACIGIQLHYSKKSRIGQVGRRGAGSGRVGLSRAESG